jgi:ribosome-binding factor A
MNRRTERVANLIRNTIGELLLAKMSDPRIDPARTSITRVEVPEDLLTARVYFSVIGTDADQRRTLAALRHAAGHIQELMTRRIELRNTPILEFQIDKQFKKTLKTLQLIHQAMEQIRQKEQAKAPDGDSPPDRPDEP